MKLFKLMSVLLLMLFFNKSYSCTLIAAGKNATTDGSVIISQTDNGDDSRLRVVHGKKYSKGAMANVYWGIQDVDRALDDYGEVLGQIPQVEQTYTYFHSAYSHINEHQLAIGESTMSQRESVKFECKAGKQIMTIEQVMIFALQRCKTAKEALKLITSLVEEYGFLPSCVEECEALAIGDPNEAWILEVFSVGKEWEPNSGKPGAVWAAKRLPDDHITIIPNWSIIKKIDLTNPDYKASANYKQFAINKGWYNPDSGKPFIWQDVYAPIPREWATGRFWLFYSRFAPNYAEWPDRNLGEKYLKGYDDYHQFVEPLSLYPFSVKPEKKISVQDVINYQREIFPGTIYDKTADTDWLVPDGEGGYKKSPLTTPFPTKPMRELLDITRRRNVSRTGYGMVAQLRGWLPNDIGGVYWFYTDNTHTSIHVPVYVGTQEMAECYKIYDPNKYDERSVRWAIDFVDNLLYLKWQEAAQDFYAVRDSLQNDFYEEQKMIDKEAQRLYKKNPKKAKKFLTKYTKDSMNRVMKAFKELRYTLITKYTNNKQGS
ncbi:MAG: C69 family dipeptidase [Calditrichia bacterium]|nr:C69 family dipeptidase [Calditrichia bacterium]